MQQAWELWSLLKQGGQFRFGFMNERLLLNSSLVSHANLTHLEVEFTKREVAMITFQAGVTLKDFKRALALLTTRPMVIAEAFAGRAGRLRRRDRRPTRCASCAASLSTRRDSTGSSTSSRISASCGRPRSTCWSATTIQGAPGPRLAARGRLRRPRRHDGGGRHGPGPQEPHVSGGAPRSSHPPYSPRSRPIRPARSSPSGRDPLLRLPASSRWSRATSPWSRASLRPSWRRAATARRRRPPFVPSCVVLRSVRGRLHDRLRRTGRRGVEHRAAARRGRDHADPCERCGDHRAGRRHAAGRAALERLGHAGRARSVWSRASRASTASTCGLPSSACGPPR